MRDTIIESDMKEDLKDDERTQCTIKSLDIDDYAFSTVLRVGARGD